MYNVGSVFFGANSAKPGGAGTITGVEADNGVSIDPASTAANRIINLGQSWGEGGDPGELLHNTEIPLNGFGFAITSEAGRTAASPNLIFLDSTDSVLGELTFDDPSNIFIGVGAGSTNLLGTGINLVGIGRGALGANTSGNNQVAVGWAAMASSSIGEQSVAIGAGAMLNSTNNYQCVAIGYEALYNNPVTLQNVAIGAGALYGFLGEGPNDAIGVDAGSDIITGLNNTLFGVFILSSGEADNNTMMGTEVWQNVTSVAGPITNNTAVGSQILSDVFADAGGNNVVIGGQSYISDAIGDDNILIGANQSSLGAAVANVVVLGQGIVNILSNVIIPGRPDQNMIIGAPIDGTAVDVGQALQLQNGEFVILEPSAPTSGNNNTFSYDNNILTDLAGNYIEQNTGGGGPFLTLGDAAGDIAQMTATQLQITDIAANVVTIGTTAIEVDGTIETLSGDAWDLGDFSAGVIVPTGSVLVTINGVGYKLAAVAA